jgi:hypothetical protein
MLTVTPALAPNPVIRRPTIIRPSECPIGQSAFHKINHRLASSQIFFRPVISDAAAIRKGPKPRPRKYVEKIICPVDLLIFRSLSMSPRAAAIRLADMSVTSCPKEKMRPMLTLRKVGQL